MTPEETATLLGIAGQFDTRMVPVDDQSLAVKAYAWSLALPDVSLTEGRTSLVEHYRTTDEPLTVAGLRKRVVEARAPRVPPFVRAEPGVPMPDWFRAQIDGAFRMPKDADEA